MKINLGIITKPQGLHGEFRVKPNGLDLSIFKNLKQVFIDNKHYEVAKITPRSVFVILKLKEFSSIDEVEKLRNKAIFYELDENRELDADEYLIKDLIGTIIVDENDNILGTLKEINNFGSADIFYCLDKNNKEFLFPFIQGTIIKFDKINKKIVIDSKKLSEIVCYED